MSIAQWMSNKARTSILKVPLYLLLPQYFCLLPWQNTRAVNQQGQAVGFLYSPWSCFTEHSYDALVMASCKSCFGQGTFKLFQNISKERERFGCHRLRRKGQRKHTRVSSITPAQCKHPGWWWNWGPSPHWCGGTQPLSLGTCTSQHIVTPEHRLVVWCPWATPLNIKITPCAWSQDSSFQTHNLVRQDNNIHLSFLNRRASGSLAAVPAGEEHNIPPVSNTALHRHPDELAIIQRCSLNLLSLLKCHQVGKTF